MKLFEFITAALLIMAFAAPANAQMQRRNPALDNIADDFIRCSAFYKITAACVGVRGRLEQGNARNPQADAALTARTDAISDGLLKGARMMYQKQGMIHEKQDLLTIKQSYERYEKKMLQDAGSSCENLDDFMDKHGDICRRISSNPEAYIEEKAGNQ